MELKIVKFTPAVAARYLEKNTMENRKIKQGPLSRLVSDMENGLWDAKNGETIKVNKKGELVDGQHRLHAIIQSGKTFSLPVLEGVSEDSFTTLDTGSSRSFADILAGKGVAGNVAIAAAILTLEQFYIGNFRIKSLSHRALLARYQQHKSIADHHGCQPFLRKCFRPNEAIFLSYVFINTDAKKGKAFMDYLAHGGAPIDSPVNTLREKLINLRIKKNTGATYVPKDYVIGSAFKAWNMQQSKQKSEPFEMLKLGENIVYPKGCFKFFNDIEVGEIER